MARWYFCKHNGYDDIYSSTAADSFIERSVKDLATAIIREGVQNAMDARSKKTPSSQPVQVSITLDTLDNSATRRWFDDLISHLHMKKVGAPDPPHAREDCPVLIFEDFWTTGLTGDYTARYVPKKKNNFVNFMYNEGITDKTDRQRGSRGVGKIVFTMASRARTIFAYTVREDKPGIPLLIGKNLLKLRQRNDELFSGPAYYLDGWKKGQAREPVSDRNLIREFLGTFPLKRKKESGLSIVIPYLDPSVTAESLRSAIVEEYYYAILAGRLEVFLSTPEDDEVFDKEHLPQTGDARIDAHVSLARWSLSRSRRPQLVIEAPPPANVQKLVESCVPEDARAVISHALAMQERLAVRMKMFIHPKSEGPQLAHFDVYMEHADATEKPIFIRELLPVSNVRDAHPVPHVRALIIIDEGPLANMLRTAEGANHTDWSPRTDEFREAYRGRLREIAFVARSVTELLKIVRGDSAKPVGGIATKYFSALKRNPTGPSTTPKRKGPATIKPVIDLPPAPPKPWRVTSTKDGFVIGNVDSIPLPDRILVRVAYDVVRGSPWSQYSRLDFDFSDERSNVAVGATGGKVSFVSKDANTFIFSPLSTTFKVSVTGFDTNRDLVIDVREHIEN